ncbi:MAG: TauD/TfdA family dioxygenase [Bdellovibrionota bacterium]
MNCKLTQLKPFGVLIEPLDRSANISILDIEILRQLFCQHHLLLLRGFDHFESCEDFSNYCELWGEISLWPFGKVLELIEYDDPADHIFDSSYVPLHWDGMYRKQVPEYQIFYCVKAPLPGQGGRTTFSNTILALEYASWATKELWSKAKGIYRRKMEFYNSETVSPIIVKHPHRDYSIIRFNEPHAVENGHLINPVDITFSGIVQGELDAFCHDLKQALYDRRNFYAHEWQTGDVVIADNFSLLHGREKFTSKSPRHIRRVQVLSDPPFDNPALESYQ